MPLPLAPTRLGCGDVSLVPLRVLRRSLSTLWHPLAHTWQSSRCTLGQRVKLRFTWACRHHLFFELLPTKQGDARQASRTKTKSTVGSSHILPSRCLRRRPRLAGQLVCCTQSSISDSPSGIAPDVWGLHLLGVRLLQPSRQFLHRELQLTPVLTERAGPHRPRSVASSTFGIKLFAIFFVSRPNVRKVETS